MDKIYTKKFQVHTYEVDFRGKALPISLLNYLQDAAGDHTVLLDVSVPELLKSNLTWLLSRYHVKIFKYPVMNDLIFVSTWPSGKQGIFALRDFEIADERGERLLAATSSWVLWNIKTRQAMRLEDHLSDRVALDRRALADDFLPLPPCHTAARELSFRVEMQDIDFNNHVNHAVYIQWALETVPEDILRTCQPVDIEAAYRAEAFYGNEIVSKIQRVEAESGPVFAHGIFHRTSGAELTRLRTAWARYA
jgi:acyl-ACP thioesterase